MNDLVLYTLLENSHFVGEMYKFNCSNSNIDTFFKDGAIQDSAKNIMRTRILFSESLKKVIGFYSLNTAQIVVSNEEVQQELVSNQDQKRYSFPTINLSYLAVDSEYQSQGFGKFLLLEVIRAVISIYGKVGCVGLSLNATYESVDFYETMGFVYLEDNNMPISLSSEIKMFIDIQTMLTILEETEDTE